MNANAGPEEHGGYTITNLRTEKENEFQMCKLQITDNASQVTREVQHYWYTGWPDHGVPDEGNVLPRCHLAQRRARVVHECGPDPRSNSSATPRRGLLRCTLATHTPLQARARSTSLSTLWTTCGVRGRTRPLWCTARRGWGARAASWQVRGAARRTLAATRRPAPPSLAAAWLWARGLGGKGRGHGVQFVARCAATPGAASLC